MSYVQSAAIIARIREVTESGRGIQRTIAVGTYAGFLPEGLDDAEIERRTMEGPRTRVRVTIAGRSPNSPPINSNLIIYDAAVDVTVVRLLDRGKQLDQDDNDAVQAAAMQDADIVRQALEYPGNLTTTEAGAPTDIIGGLLRWSGSPPSATVGQVSDGAQHLETTHQFTAQLIARPATSRVVTFTSSTTWQVPPGVTSIGAYAWGGGGGGGAAVVCGGGGGGGGGLFNGTNPGAAVTPGETLTITIAPGGAGAGGSTTVSGSFGTVTAPGGSVGVTGSAGGQGAGGAAGGAGFGGFAGGAGGGSGGVVAYGGGGGGGAGLGSAGGTGAAIGTAGTAGLGVVSGYPGGRGGTGAAGATAATDGAFPGGGGGGASTGAAAGLGAAGYVVILY